MARMALSTGACPVCDLDVPRTLQLVAGIQTETYHCSVHGRIAYEPRCVPLGTLHAAASLGAVPTATLPAGIQIIQ